MTDPTSRPISATMFDDAPSVLALRGIGKVFPGVRALAGVDFDLRAGEVHAVMGENGAGKSTLMKIVVGVDAPDAGTIERGGEPVRFAHPQEPQERGVSIISQELTLLPERTVAQNIFLGREPKRGPFVDSRAMERATAAILTDLGVERSIPATAAVGRLSGAQQQTVEIAKALSFAARIVIMDEPTASLAPAEAEALFARIRALRERGLAFIYYVSHRIDEVMALTDRITVLKAGERVAPVVHPVRISPAEDIDRDAAELDPEAGAQHAQRQDGGGDDDGVDALPPLLRPVDILEVQPERELVERQRGADPEQDRVRLAVVVRRQADAEVAADEQQQDARHEVVQVGAAAGGDVAEDPRVAAGANRVRDEPDRPERDQEREQHEDLGLLLGIHDVVAVGIAHASRQPLEPPHPPIPRRHA